MSGVDRLNQVWDHLKTSAAHRVGERYGAVRAAVSRRTHARPPLFPKRFAIESASACNLECPMCPTPGKQRKNGIVVPDFFRTLVDEIAQYGADQLFLHLWGEPLIHPHLGELIRFAADKPTIAETIVSTNATLLTGDRADKVLESGLSCLTLSLDGATPETYEALRYGAKFDETMANVSEFLERRRALGKGPRLVFQIIEMQQTKDEVADFRRRWEPLLGPRDQISVKPYNQWADHDGVLAKPGIQFRSPCLGFLWDFLAVTWDGKVLPCCFDCEGSMVLGDATKQTLKEIWDGPAVQELRRAHLELDFSKYPLCAGCDLTKETLDVSRLTRMVRQRALGLTEPLRASQRSVA
jgi:radical SAM protein with 4Fe4S-binding SPASM domain